MVFDGNHYLYLYDEEYATRKPDYAGSHEYLEGVDVMRMEEIARGLPLSRKRRPQWDADMLITLGVNSIHIHTDGRDSLRSESEKGLRTMPFSFFIMCTRRYTAASTTVLLPMVMVTLSFGSGIFACILFL